MAYRRIDLFSSAAAWQARTPGGAPSVEIGVASDAALTRFGTGASLASTGTANALGHRFERSFPPEDLSRSDELRLWIRGTRVGDGAASRPIYLELRLASAAVGLDDPTNAWSRLLPVARASTWELHRVTLAGLPASIRAAANTLRITCIDASAPFAAHFDACFAARPEMIADVESALIERFDGALSVGGVAVRAELHHTATATPALPPAPPAIRIRHEGIEAADTSTRVHASRLDHVANGHALAGDSKPFDLLYAFEPFFALRAEEAAVLDGLLVALAPGAELVVGGLPAPIELVGSERSSALGERLALRCRIRSRMTLRAPLSVFPVEHVSIGLDQP